MVTKLQLSFITIVYDEIKSATVFNEKYFDFCS